MQTCDVIICGGRLFQQSRSRAVFEYDQRVTKISDAITTVSNQTV